MDIKKDVKNLEPLSVRRRVRPLVGKACIQPLSKANAQLKNPSSSMKVASTLFERVERSWKMACRSTRIDFFFFVGLAIAFLVLATPSFGDEVKILPKRGGQFVAYVLPVHREDRLAVRRLDPRDIAEFSLLSRDGQHGAQVQNIAWSDGGEYLAFSTTSSGGHSPWNYRTYVFSTERWTFLALDDAISPIVSPDFAFKDASHLEIEVLKAKDSETDDSEKKIIDLNALPWPKGEIEGE